MSAHARWLVSVALASFLGAGCHARPPVVPPPAAVDKVESSPAPRQPPPPPPAPPSRAVAAVPPAAVSEEELFRRTTLDELNAESPLGDAFFDYDRADLRDDARQSLQQDAVWLRKWTSTTITVEGHCDERGTAEYNIALGQRRATAVRSYLMDLGISAGRITTTSLGKEQPFCHRSDESCWAQNRRGHFVVTAK